MTTASQESFDGPENEIRENEQAVTAPAAHDAGLAVIGRISTPWSSRLLSPRQDRHDGPVGLIEIFEPWVTALQGAAAFKRLELLFWLTRARRDLVLQSPASNGAVHGTFSLRSPVRSNYTVTSIVLLECIERRGPRRLRTGPPGRQASAL